jgi:hypothetical protein
MKLLSALTLFLALGATSGPCVYLDQQTYCQGWSNSTKILDTYEFVRSGETVDNWKNLVTLQLYKVRPAFAEFIDAQNTQLLKSGTKPRWIQFANPRHTHETATAVTLTSGSDTEYTFFYFYEDAGQPIKGVIFSRHKALASGEPPSDAQIERWVAQMNKMSMP